MQRPSLATQALFSFFGHYGVQIFVFLSAYGLAKSHWDDKPSWLSFFSGRIRKLYPSVLLVVVLWSIGMCLGVGPLRFCRQYALHILLMVTGLSTVLRFDLPPIGPWWFIPFIVQFYALWPLLRRFTIRFGPGGLLLLSLASLALVVGVNPLLARCSLNLFFTPLGHLPVLCLGIFAARYAIRIPHAVGVMSCAAVFAAGSCEWIWIFAPLAATTAGLWAYTTVRETLRRSVLLQRMGNYSLFVFLLNGIVRFAFIRFAVSPGLQVALGFTSLACSFGIAACCEEVLRPEHRRKLAHATGSHGQPQLAERSAASIPAQ
jgi:peptidoglycan/LPS O-acetylase OafA/YrhL